MACGETFPLAPMNNCKCGKSDYLVMVEGEPQTAPLEQKRTTGFEKFMKLLYVAIVSCVSTSTNNSTALMQLVVVIKQNQKSHLANQPNHRHLYQHQHLSLLMRKVANSIYNYTSAAISLMQTMKSSYD